MYGEEKFKLVPLTTSPFRTSTQLYRADFLGPKSFTEMFKKFG